MELLLKTLSGLNGVSGDEDEVREFILKKISPYCSCNVDRLGNIIAFRRGKKHPAKKVVFEAHMDETGYIITSIDDFGCLHFLSNGVSPNVTCGKFVRVRATREKERWLDGVVGLAPIHLIKKKEFSDIPEQRELVIDIGAKNKKDAEKYVIEGDYAYFNTEFGRVGNYIKGKALDDRAGCAVMIDMISKELEYDAYFVFCVQEEVGLRGSAVACAAIKPDYAIVLEGTTAADIGGSPAHKKVCELGNGVAVSFADSRTLYKPELVSLAFECAEEKGINTQIKTYVSGGTDAARWQRESGASNVLTISVPVRYLHSRASLASEADIFAMEKLAVGLLEKINS